jgi:hypothetical protein
LTNFEVHHAANINDGSVKIDAEKRKKERKLDCEKGENYPGFYENVRRSFVPNPLVVKGIPSPSSPKSQPNFYPAICVQENLL